MRERTRLIIDPSITSMGLAIFKEGELVRAGLVAPPKSAAHNRLAWIACRTIAFAHGHAPIDAIYYEEPVLRGVGKGAKPADLFKLSQSVGAAVGGLAATVMDRIVPLHAVPIAGAKGWKGQLPKNVTHEHMWRVLTEDEASTLRACELKFPKAQRHNIYDAVCIGLFVEGRAPWTRKH
jgi:hypothetical protein